jgi:NAD(P)-dependent dehydrogenase (short-subunit alcohol dehydrogenase family)
MADLRFDGRVAVVTGAGRGLGRAHARLLAAHGAQVVVNDPGGSLGGDGGDPGPAEAVVREIRDAGGEAVACTDSVATPEGGRAIIETATQAFGRLDILVHNAGNVRPAPLTEMSYEDFEAVLGVHLRGAFHVVRPAFPLMASAGYGRVVLTSSIGGIYGNLRVANYAVAKSAMIGLNNVIALEGEAVGVRSNIIVPGAITRMAGGIDTSGLPPMSPDQVSPMVGWLAHESCSVSGEMFIAIAGRMARAFVAESAGVWAPDWSLDAAGLRPARPRRAPGLQLRPRPPRRRGRRSPRLTARQGGFGHAVAGPAPPSRARVAERPSTSA